MLGFDKKLHLNIYWVTVRIGLLKNIKKILKNFKKLLTKHKWSGIIGKLSARKRREKGFCEKDKKFQKTLQKGIDKSEAMWYNTEAVAEKGSEWSLKIEQQEISTKQL